jgi:transcriptional regulator with XRE-family HTH domain
MNDCSASTRVVRNRSIPSGVAFIAAALRFNGGTMSLAAKLRELRLRKSKSLQQVADDVGASKAHIWDLETGKSTNPSIDLLKNLSRCFDVTVADLIGENPEADSQDSEVVAMYRDLKELTPADREALRGLMEHLKNKKKEGG